MNRNYRLRKEVKGSERAQEYRDTNQTGLACCCIMHLQRELVDIFC